MLKKNRLLLLATFFITALCHNIQCSEPPKQPKWSNLTKKLNSVIDKQKALSDLLKNEQINVSLIESAVVGKSPKKLNLILLYQKEDSNKEIYTKTNNSAHQAFQKLGNQLRQIVTFPNNEIPGKIELISIGYTNADQNTAQALRGLFSLLLDINKGATNVKNITYAFGESAHLVNMISRVNSTLFAEKKTKKQSVIDTMIHIQSPIYEWYWSTLYRGYYQEKKWTPASFRRLYNIYTKDSIPTTNIVRYPDRKYRQQARTINNQIVMPVKNIRATKLVSNKLMDVTIQDMHAPAFINKIADTMQASEQYQVNFDLLGNLFVPKNPNYEPVFVINRFITEKQGNILMQYGSGKGQKYTILANINQQALKNTKKAFTQDVDMSAAQLINLTDIPNAEKGWVPILWAGLKTDLDRIKNTQNNIKTNSLYLLEAKPILNEQFIKNQLPQLNSSALPLNYVLNKIYLGGVYAYQLLYGEPKQIPTNTQEEYIESIIALMWYFFSAAINKDQGYEEGTFIIRDYDGKVFNFLMAYAKKFNKKITGTAKDTPSADNPFAYCRYSSHFKQFQNKYKHYGIDIRKGAQGLALPLLPAEKRHILFSQIEDGKSSFIKMENYGVYGLLEGTLPHGKEFVVAQARKLLPKYITGLKSDDDPTYRKERIPNDFKKKMKTILETVKHPNTSKIVALISQDGIQTISKNYIEQKKELFFPKDMDQKAQQTFKQEIEKLRTQLINQYDHINNRYGREVILTPQELYSSLYYYLANTDNNLKNQFKNFAESIIQKKPIKFDLALVKKYYNDKTMQTLSRYVKELAK